MDDEIQDNEDQVTPVSVSVIIEKPELDSAIEVSTTVQGQSFFIDNVAFIPSSQLALDQTAEGDWARRGRYTGPVFADLDEDLVETFHSFIEERGFDAPLAEFISDYVVRKEQDEYVSWLGNVESFLKK